MKSSIPLSQSEQGQGRSQEGERPCHAITDNRCPQTPGSESQSPEAESITETDDVSAGTDDSIYAPDGGWGWMVTLASFMVAFIVDGIVTSFGLVLPELLTAFGAGVSLTSFPLAIIVAMFLLAGPFTAYLVKRWGCRQVGFCGGLLAALGMAASAYAPTIEVFILCFGVVAGVGIGLIYLPSITMVNIYFHKKRGVVAGIITSGSGFGLLAMAPLTKLLLEEYGWRGCYLIIAGVTLNFCVCASLMRPLEIPRSQRRPVLSGNIVSTAVAEGELAGFPFFEKEDNLSLISVEELKDVNEDLKHRPHLSSPHHGSVPSSAKNMALDLPALSGSHCQMSTGSGLLEVKTDIIRSKSHGHLHLSAGHTTRPVHPVNILSAWLTCQVPPSLSQHTLHFHQSTDKMAPVYGECRKGEKISWSHLKDSSSKRHHCSDSRVHWGQAPSFVPPFEDTLKPGVAKLPHRHKGSSLLSIKMPTDEKGNETPAKYSLLSSETSSSSSPSEDVPAAQDGERKRGSHWLMENRVFVLFLVGAFLIQLVSSVPTLFTPAYAYQHGVSKEEVVTILSVFGVLNTLGRLMAGLLVFWGWRSLHVYNLGTLLAGLACLAFPLCTSFLTITVCLGLHGFFLGAFPPLQSVILVEYLGLPRLASTFGIMCMIKAFASSAGAPLAGLLYSLTSAYTVPVVACGGGLLLAVVFHQMMDCTS